MTVNVANSSSITHRPAPKITWKKNSVPLEHGKNSFEILDAFRGRLLNIINVEKDKHQDQYTCEGENSQNTGSPLKFNITLLVEGIIKYSTLKNIC